MVGAFTVAAKRWGGGRSQVSSTGRLGTRRTRRCPAHGRHKTEPKKRHVDGGAVRLIDYELLNPVTECAVTDRG